VSVEKRDGERFKALVQLMSRLRSQDGCPWDREQTPETLKPYIIEEAHEVLEAIDSGDPDRVCEELGDLLFQIIFQAQIFSERGEFDVEDVTDKIYEKMVRRHPHVFGDATVQDAEDVRRNWVQIKREHEGKGDESALGRVPRTLPALLRARRITENAAELGFDWRRLEDVKAKVEEEWSELKQAIADKSQKRADHELGDMLFALVNLSRFLRLNAEESLSGAIRRFEARFHYMEESLRRAGKSFEEVELEDLDRLWEEAKSKGY
jgi:tetrapyrrole methylase family protein/MazG family protein